jgi:hypothetical protein
MGAMQILPDDSGSRNAVEVSVEVSDVTLRTFWSA